MEIATQIELFHFKLKIVMVNSLDWPSKGLRES